MMRDFTLSAYRKLLTSLQQAAYTFLTVEEYASLSPSNPSTSHTQPPFAPIVILRHDVDLRPTYALATAKLEASLGIRATYYFRIVPQSNKPTIICQIAALGHEIGYHYEDLSLAHGNTQQAYQSFTEHLAYFRQFYPVSTICMHGAPTSAYDGRDLWKTYNYHQLNILAEPYLDFDYSQLFYLTDTGRRWDGYKVSVRDKIPVYQDQWSRQGLSFHSTSDICQALQQPTSPLRQQKAILITTHPQRYTDAFLPWLIELLSQSCKNILKRLLLRLR